MGFCMGGLLTFLAGQEASVDAIAPFYGTPDAKLGKVGNLHPLRGFRDVYACLTG